MAEKTTKKRAAKSSSRAVIEVKGLEKKFELTKDKYQVALQAVDFDIEATEFVILFGPSGCGKSTVLNLIAGLELPTAGSIKIRGEELTKFNKIQLARHHRTKIGMVFQQFNLIANLSVKENVALPGAFAGSNYETRTKRAEHLLEMFGLTGMADNLPQELSGGEQQKVAIARSLMNNPWIVLVDEPTGNLDSKSSEEVMDILEHLNQKSRRTILLVTHNPDYLNRAHRVFFMKDGKIINSKVNRRVVHRRADTKTDDELSYEMKGGK
ncbi:MAG: putative ABC transport system ATP-binding protein [Candidatus Berkelbacteria bacterium Licking1014_7]|uniref:Putative ABC transport system ATP-binding protein n=1 Tax=Candidatus Berkelbacteria bacterium Licking1014_7 TaxID=2017147 RepID=A0A554LIY4_9BACT|nr:MAG: putative ABC transport system ATP-binding protein [Candidatus Berkelbacteria bacterium Licking1014_7]